jgi:nitrate/TMAO reductase-like tetraheme cytochrome c subunit
MINFRFNHHPQRTHMAKRFTFRSLKKTALILATIAFSMVSFFTLSSQNETEALNEETTYCLSCHGHETYEINDTITGEYAKLKMFKELQIDLLKFRQSTHGEFKCTDCHSSDFEDFPHPFSAKAEASYLCIDCHGDDEDYASYHFDTIEQEYLKSVHVTEKGDDFSCWNCHNPHAYKLTDKTPGQLGNRIAENNSVCLDCHGNINSYNSLIGREKTDLIKSHEWLPNQPLHFSRVRCIDCHAATHDSILVAHMVLPAEDAVKNCVECHSTNSILWGSLYKHQAMTTRNELGFYNGMITNEAYIIGANRNYYLNIISIVIFILVVIGIAIHATLRYIYRHKKHAK